jgi:flagellar protein FlgJ
MKINRFMQVPEPKSSEQQLKDVSSMYEKHFLREMMKSMRSTVQESGFVKTNHAEKIFRGQLDEEYVEKWADRGGIGLGDMIYTQLVEKFGEQMGIKKAIDKPVGPIHVTDKSQYTGMMRPQQKSDRLQYNFNVDKLGQSESRQVQSPWSGTLTKKTSMGPDENLFEIAHDNGLKSRLYFTGQSEVSTGSKLQAGETLGVLGVNARNLVWDVQTVSE